MDAASACQNSGMRVVSCGLLEGLSKIDAMQCNPSMRLRKMISQGASQLERSPCGNKS